MHQLMRGSFVDLIGEFPAEAQFRGAHFSWSCTMASVAPCWAASVLTKGGSSENKIMSAGAFHPDM
jgi:hypothetical protein